MVATANRVKTFDPDADLNDDCILEQAAKIAMEYCAIQASWTPARRIVALGPLRVNRSSQNYPGTAIRIDVANPLHPPLESAPMSGHHYYGAEWQVSDELPAVRATRFFGAAMADCGRGLPNGMLSRMLTSDELLGFNDRLPET